MLGANKWMQYIYYLKVANKIFICLYVQSYNGKNKNLTAKSSMPSRTNLQIKYKKKERKREREKKKKKTAKITRLTPFITIKVYKS